jgi:RNA polymerase sigma factor (sigma-70 family)
LPLRWPVAQTDLELEIADHRAIEPEIIERLTIRAAVVGLDARSQELVALRYGADLTARQIAEILDERTNTVEVALHRALGKLRRALAQEEEPETAEEAAPRQRRSAAAV